MPPSGLRKFDVRERRDARERAQISIPDRNDTDHEFRRRRMTGERFRDILEEEPVVVRKSQAEVEAMDADEREQYARQVGRQNYESVYWQVARIIEPVNPDQIGFAADDEDALYAWLEENLEFDDAHPLIEFVEELSGGSKGKAGS